MTVLSEDQVALEAFELHRDMDRIEAHLNDIKLITEHPYWRVEHTDRYLGLLERNLELLRAIWPWGKDVSCVALAKQDEKAG